MRKTLYIAAALTTLIATACTAPTNAPLIIEGKLLVPSRTTLILPSGGILFAKEAQPGDAQ
jgi:hypothetical protein